MALKEIINKYYYYKPMDKNTPLSLRTTTGYYTASDGVAEIYYVDKNGRRQGKYESYYRGIHQLKSVYTYKDDTKDGHFIEFWPNGRTKKEGMYEKDTLVESRQFDETGKEIIDISSDKEPKPVSDISIMRKILRQVATCSGLQPTGFGIVSKDERDAEVKENKKAQKRFPITQPQKTGGRG